MFPLRLFCNHPFDQPQAALNALDQADEIRNQRAGGAILVL
jgi:hypothetical protein